MLLVDGIFVWVHGCVAGYKAFEDVIVEFRHMLRLLAFFCRPIEWTALKLCLFIFWIGNGKAPCFSKETLQIMWEKCQEECQFNFICQSTSLFAHKLSTITNNLTHILQTI